MYSLNLSLPLAIVDAAAKKLRADVAAATSAPPPPTYARPPTLPIAGNSVDLVGGGAETLLRWARRYGVQEGLHEVSMLQVRSIIHTGPHTTAFAW